MAWLAVIVAGALEIVWAFAMKQSNGFTRLVPSIITILGLVGSLGLLSFAMRTLPLGTAYVVWVGVGAVGVFLVGIIALGEEASALQVFAALLIIVGGVLLKISSPA